MGETIEELTIWKSALGLVKEFYEAEADKDAFYELDWRSVALLAMAYYAKDENKWSGGNCHVVLDDTNIEDRSIHWTRGQCDAKGDKDGSCLMGLLLLLPECERRLVSEVCRGTEGLPLGTPAYVSIEVRRYAVKDRSNDG